MAAVALGAHGSLALFLSSALPLSFHVTLNHLNWWGQKTLVSLQYSYRQELDGILEGIWMLVGTLAWLDTPKTVPYQEKVT